MPEKNKNVSAWFWQRELLLQGFRKSMKKTVSLWRGRSFSFKIHTHTLPPSLSAYIMELLQFFVIHGKYNFIKKNIKQGRLGGSVG